MKKKLIITGSVLLGIIITVIILCFTVFTVKTVEVDFRTSTTQAWSEEEIVENSKIPYGKCLLFMSKDQFVNNLETKYPYIEVINIEKVFPSKMVIHCVEREELYVMQNGEDVVYLDKDFKVLKIEQALFESQKTNPILLEDLSYQGEIEVGKVLSIDQTAMKRFYASMLENNKNLSQVLGFCKEISFEDEFNTLTKSNETHITIQTFGERKVKILNISTNLNYKIQKVFQTIPMLYETLVDNGDYTTEEVDRCEIIVGNQIIDKNELYVHVCLDGQTITSPTKNE